MDVTVVIPTHARPRKLAACVGALSRQSLEPGTYEVLVGIDGEDGGTTAAARAAWTLDQNLLTVEAFSKRGQAAVRNALLPRAMGRTLVFLNDDMVPERGLLAAHHAEHERQRRAGSAALVIGSAPWVVHQPDRLFDRLVRETSMVFFYNRMDDAASRAERDRDWGFRHAWLLNLSADGDLVRELGGFTVFPSTYGYEDDEFAWRAASALGARVLYRPEASARHDHRMEPGDYLDREYRLGYAAWGFAKAAPRCAGEMFGRDVTSAAEIEYGRAVVDRERLAAERAWSAFRVLVELDAASVAPTSEPVGAHLIELLYQQHLPLKRYCWRTGLLDAAESRPAFSRPVLWRT